MDQFGIDEGIVKRFFLRTIEEAFVMLVEYAFDEEVTGLLTFVIILAKC